MFNKLKNERIAAMKSGDKDRKDVIASLIAAVQSATITPKGRLEITDDLVNEVIIKQKKIAEEMIDTCPANRTDLLAEYNIKLAIIDEFAPRVIEDEEEIKAIINAAVAEAGIVLDKNARGPVMKIITSKYGKTIDMKTVNKVFGEIA